MPHGTNLSSSSATLPGGPTVRAGLVCWPKPGTGYGKTATIGAARRHVPVVQPLQYLA